MTLTADDVQVLLSGGTLTGFGTKSLTAHFPRSSGWGATVIAADADVANDAQDTHLLDVPVPLSTVAVQFVRRLAAENTKFHREWKA